MALLKPLPKKDWWKEIIEKVLLERQKITNRAGPDGQDEIPTSLFKKAKERVTTL